MREFFACLFGAAAAAATVPATAALIVSGDSSIAAQSVMSGAANQTFFRNIVEGATIVVQDSFSNSARTLNLVAFYNSNGFSASLLADSAQVTTATLSNVDLFIAYTPEDFFDLTEISVLSSFLLGGKNVLFMGENLLIPITNAAVNDALVGLGSAMRIVEDVIDPGFHTAQLLGVNQYSLNTTGFQYAATSRVTGGTGIFSTATGNQTFIAFESQFGAVSIPGTLSLASLALVGVAVMRRMNAGVE